jgi:hypothetical protein
MSFVKLIGLCEGQEHVFGEEDLLLCSHEVPAFSLSSRRWWRVNVTDVGAIDFNTEAYDKLILPDNQKEIIHSLVNVHSNKLLSFDDVIAGKGKGMVFLLHGESGTGKTLTAGKFETLKGNSRSTYSLPARSYGRLHQKAIICRWLR